MRSALRGETYDFTDGFDNIFTFQYDIWRILRRRIPIAILTGSQSLFEGIVIASTTTEKRLFIDIWEAREAFER